MNEDIEDEFSSFDSENGICHVEWTQPIGEDFEFWYCCVHLTEYYKDCVNNPDLAQNA
jgi:hypothetical protein